MTKSTGVGRGKRPATRVDDQGRECTKCGTYKVWDDFYPHPTGNHGRTSRCASCILPAQSGISKRAHRADKARVMAAYGGKCSCCGETELAFLTIDHVNGDGAEHRRELGRKTVRYSWFIQNGFPKGFQVLCANCNLGRHINGGICPHQVKAVIGL